MLTGQQILILNRSSFCLQIPYLAIHRWLIIFGTKLLVSQAGRQSLTKPLNLIRLMDWRMIGFGNGF